MVRLVIITEIARCRINSNIRDIATVDDGFDINTGYQVNQGFDYAILELENDLSESYGYIGIDMGLRNANNSKEIEVCGYPHDKEMWHSSGEFISS